MSTEKDNAEKQFDLKNIELRMIETLQNTYYTQLSTFFSYIALERLAYPVSESTRFRMEDGKLFIKEETETTPEAEVEVA